MNRGTITGPLVLILLGGLFLASNFNLIPADIWSRIWHFWPVTLIMVGIELLTGRSASSGVRILGRLVVLAIVGCVLALAWLGIGNGSGDGNFSGPTGNRQEISVPLEGATGASLQIHGGVGTFDLRAADASTAAGVLVSGAVVGRRMRRVEPSIVRSANRLDVTLSGADNNSINIVNPFDWRNVEENWKLVVNPDVPLDLTLEGGVGQSTADLSGLRLDRLKVSGGVGPMVITLPRRGQVSADISGGVGPLELEVPEGVAAQVKVDRGLGGLSVANRFAMRGEDTYESEGYATATDRLQISINGGVGSVNVR